MDESLESTRSVPIPVPERAGERRLWLPLRCNSQVTCYPASATTSNSSLQLASGSCSFLDYRPTTPVTSINGYSVHEEPMIESYFASASNDNEYLFDYGKHRSTCESPGKMVMADCHDGDRPHLLRRISLTGLIEQPFRSPSPNVAMNELDSYFDSSLLSTEDDDVDNSNSGSLGHLSARSALLHENDCGSLLYAGVLPLVSKTSATSHVTPVQPTYKHQTWSSESFKRFRKWFKQALKK